MACDTTSTYGQVSIQYAARRHGYAAKLQALADHALMRNMKIQWAKPPGSMRRVLLTDNYAIKFPRVRVLAIRREIAERTFWEGFRANREERRRWRGTKDFRLCPVLLADRFGLILVMPRAKPLTDREFWELELLYITEGSFAANRFYQGDMKRENYGTLHGKIVRLDYGERPRN